MDFCFNKNVLENFYLENYTIHHLLFKNLFEKIKSVHIVELINRRDFIFDCNLKLICILIMYLMSKLYIF